MRSGKSGDGEKGSWSVAGVALYPAWTLNFVPCVLRESARARKISESSPRHNRDVQIPKLTVLRHCYLPYASSLLTQNHQLPVSRSS